MDLYFGYGNRSSRPSIIDSDSDSDIDNDSNSYSTDSDSDPPPANGSLVQQLKAVIDEHAERGYDDYQHLLNRVPYMNYEEVDSVEEELKDKYAELYEHISLFNDLPHIQSKAKQIAYDYMKNNQFPPPYVYNEDGEKTNHVINALVGVYTDRLCIEAIYDDLQVRKRDTNNARIWYSF